MVVKAIAFMTMRAFLLIFLSRDTFTIYIPFIFLGEIGIHFHFTMRMKIGIILYGVILNHIVKREESR